jgi:hypothetical protein
MDHSARYSTPIISKFAHQALENFCGAADFAAEAHRGIKAKI